MFILKNVKKFALGDRIAAVGEEGEMSYRALEDRSEALAAYFLETFSEKNPVIIWGDKEHDMLVAVLACLKSGRPYVMVPNYLPEMRVQQMTESCCPDVVMLTGKKPFPVDGIRVIAGEEKEAIIAANSGKTVGEENWIAPDDMVCIFYTSGSTGNPKGVMVTRRNIEALIDWWDPVCNLGIENPKWLNFTPYAFSSSMGTIYDGLGSLGATCYAIDKPLSGDYPRLIDFIVKTNPHYFDCTPTFADICMKDERFNSNVMTNLRQFSVGGEPCSHGTARRMKEHFPNTQLLNAYGATETTIGPIYCEITEEMIEADKPMPIGYSAFNARCDIVDEEGKPVKEGETGELVVISDMVTKGYYKNEERTRENYFFNDKGEWCFNTHDLIWRDEKGLIYYVGRANNLVKVGGYRVEIEEVERYLSKIEGIESVAVAPAMQGVRTMMLVAYVVMKPGEKTGITATMRIKKELGGMIHPYMIPQKFVYLDAIPKNTNDKVDRVALKEMSRIKSEDK